MTREINKLILSRIKQLLLEHRDTYRVDLHLHTLYSSDGTQTVLQALKKAKEKHIDIVSIADHDSIRAYSEIMKNNYFDNSSLPIIVPGVEFTVSFPEYCERCHILKYFYDINDIGFIGILKQNREAFNNRIHIWFKSIEKNLCLQYFFSKYDIRCSEEQYRFYLGTHRNPIPDYANLMEYLFSILRPHGIGVWDIYNKIIELNQNDLCISRRHDVESAMIRFYKKYHQQDINDNYRKLRPLLAPVGIVDTYYPQYDPIGSLSINEFGQVPIESLMNSGVNAFAHPNANKLYLMEQLEGVISGLELNAHSDIDTNQKIKQIAQERSLVATRGSDKHTDTDEYYIQMEFYDMKYGELQKLYDLFKKCI